LKLKITSKHRRKSSPHRQQQHHQQQQQQHQQKPHLVSTMTSNSTSTPPSSSSNTKHLQPSFVIFQPAPRLMHAPPQLQNMMEQHHKQMQGQIPSMRSDFKPLVMKRSSIPHTPHQPSLHHGREKHMLKSTAMMVTHTTPPPSRPHGPNGNRPRVYQAKPIKKQKKRHSVPKIKVSNPLKSALANGHQYLQQYNHGHAENDSRDTSIPPSPTTESSKPIVANLSTSDVASVLLQLASSSF